MTEEMNHPEWTKVNSLTSPQDRGTGVYKSDLSAPPLTEEQVEAALNTIVHNDFIEKFPRVERQFADPPIHLQTYGLISFVPSKGATPDKDGVYGFAKIRGNYATAQECEERSEFLIRNVDSYHGIFKCYIGRPFPITVDPKYAAKVDEIDIRKKAGEVISEDVKAKRQEEKREIEQVKEREKKLLEESKEDFIPDPYEKYTVLRVKKAQLVWGYSQTMKQLENMKSIIIKTRAEITEMDAQNPDFTKEYFERYMKARRDAGIPDDQNTEENFVKYMVEDIDLGF
jgi:hypothetical protein